MWCVARFGTIYKILKTWKNTHGEVLLLSKVAGWKPATLLKVTLLDGYFSRFLNYTNSTKSRKTLHLVILILIPKLFPPPVQNHSCNSNTNNSEISMIPYDSGFPEVLQTEQLIQVTFKKNQEMISGVRVPCFFFLTLNYKTIKQIMSKKN